MRKLSGDIGGELGRRAESGSEAVQGWFEIVAIGSSAGGIQALKQLLAELPREFPLPILVCQHVLRNQPSRLPQILAYRTALRVVAATQSARLLPGTIYCAPSNQHLVVRPDRSLGLADSARVNNCRPSADVLFQSVADVYRARAISVVLTGYGLDGAFGSRAIQHRGGLSIAQDEASAEVFDMPSAARDIGGADLVMPLGQIAGALDTLARLDKAAIVGNSPVFQL